MKKKYIFNEEMILFLKENYFILGPKQIGEIFNFPIKIVCKKARKLNLERGITKGAELRKNKWEFKEYSYELGYLIGVYLGDGNCYIDDKTKNKSGYFRLGVIDEDFADTVKFFLEKITGYKVSKTLQISKKKNIQNKYIITFCNRDFVRFLIKEFGPANKKIFKFLPTEEGNKGLVEGLFDSEGTVNGKRWIIRMYMDIENIKNISFFKNIKRNKNYINKPNLNKLSKQNIPFYSFSVPIKYWNNIGLGTYIKRKAIKGNINFKNVILNG